MELWKVGWHMEAGGSARAGERIWRPSSLLALTGWQQSLPSLFWLEKGGSSLALGSGTGCRMSGQLVMPGALTAAQEARSEPPGGTAETSSPAAGGSSTARCAAPNVDDASALANLLAPELGALRLLRPFSRARLPGGALERPRS